MKPGLKADKSDNTGKRGSQREKSANSVGTRILEALDGRTKKWLSVESGISESTISDYIRDGIAKTDPAIAIANALKVSLEWLLTGRNPEAPPTDDDADDVSIDSIDFDYGLGGTFADIEEGAISVEKTKFSRSWLRKFTYSPPELLVTTTGVGDSMEPLISDHDVVIIDRSERLKDAMGDKTWAIIFGGVGMIKRLRPMPDGTVKIMSVNRTYPDELATDNDLHIVGRVVAVVKRY